MEQAVKDNLLPTLEPSQKACVQHGALPYRTGASSFLMVGNRAEAALDPETSPPKNPVPTLVLSCLSSFVVEPRPAEMKAVLNPLRTSWS